MKLKRNLLTLCVAAGVTALPVLAMRNPQTQTGKMLNEIAFNARNTENDAGALHSYTWDQLDWMAQGLQLTEVKADINTLGREVYQLQTESPLTPSERVVVNRIARRVNLMGNDAEDAILFGRHHPDLLWTPGYENDIRLLDSNAQRLTGEVHQAIELENSSERS